MSRSKDAWLTWPRGGLGCADVRLPPDEERTLWRPGESTDPGDEIIVVIDTETTGLERDTRIVEIGAARVRLPSCDVLEIRSERVNPQCPIPQIATRIHGITDAMVRDKPTLHVVLPKFVEFIGKAPVLAHNSHFDRRVIATEAARIGLPSLGLEFYDSIAIAKAVIPKKTLRSFSLPELIKHFGIDLRAICAKHNLKGPTAHRALPDVLALTAVLRSLLAAAGGKTFRELAGSPDSV